MRRLILILGLICGSASAALPEAGAPLPGGRPGNGQHEDAGEAPPRLPGRRLTPSDAARQVQRLHGGKVLAVQPDGTGYRVKILKNGEVRIYHVNP